MFHIFTFVKYFYSLSLAGSGSFSVYSVCSFFFLLSEGNIENNDWNHHEIIILKSTVAQVTCGLLAFGQPTHADQQKYHQARLTTKSVRRLKITTKNRKPAQDQRNNGSLTKTAASLSKELHFLGQEKSWRCMTSRSSSGFNHQITVADSASFSFGRRARST